jgi:hypothetical protein
MSMDIAAQADTAVSDAVDNDIAETPAWCASFPGDDGTLAAADSHIDALEAQQRADQQELDSYRHAEPDAIDRKEQLHTSIGERADEISDWMVERRKRFVEHFGLTRRAELPQRTVRLMGRTQVAAYLRLRGLHSLGGRKLPEPDGYVGGWAGWTSETIEEWLAARPGSGWWGARLGDRPLRLPNDVADSALVFGRFGL